MSEPAAPLPPMDWQSLPTFCSRCEIHQATNHKPVCPVCLDDETRALAHANCDCGWCER